MKLLLLFFILRFTHAEGIATGNNGVVAPAIDLTAEADQIDYSLAPRLPDKEEFTFKEISEPWRRVVRDGVSMVRMPTGGANRLKGPCGTTHYLPTMLAQTPAQLETYKTDKTRSTGIHTNQEVGTYVTETAACALMDIFQEWTKRCEVFVRDKNVCAIGWGDSSHRDSANFPPHSVKYHGYGECMDIRPIRKGNFPDWITKHADDPLLNQYLRRGLYKTWPISHVDDFYDRDLTRELLILLKEKGGDPIFFLDPDMRSDAEAKKKPVPEYTDLKGHKNHIHVCFPKNEKNTKACENFRYKRAQCGSPLY